MARSYKGRISIVVGAVAGLGLVVWGLQPNPVNVNLARVQRGSLSSTITADGRTRIRNVYAIVAPVDGDVERILLKVGDVVSQGTVVARLRPVAPRPLDDRSRAEAAATVTAAQSAVTQAEATYMEAAAALVHAESELATNRKLANDGIAPKNNVEHAEHQVEIRRQAVQAAKAAIQTAKAELARAKVLAESTNSTSSAQPSLPVRSPVKGRVLKLLHESGGPVTAGWPLLEIGNTSGIEVTTDLLTEDAMTISPLAPALIAEWGGNPLKAQVRNIEPAAFTKVSALGLEEQRVLAILDFVDTPPATLGHDFHVSVSIVVWRGDNVLTIPSTSLFRSGNDWAVFVVSGDRAQLRLVKPGRSDGTRTVIDEGLTEGEDIVAQPSDLLQNDSRVRAIR